jgi:hypothetical protein
MSRKGRGMIQSGPPQRHGRAPTRPSPDAILLVPMEHRAKATMNK